jgi:hypothetical protein
MEAHMPCMNVRRQAIGLQVSTGARSKLDTAASKGVAVLRKRALDIAVSNYVHRMLTGCSLDVHWMSTGCHWMLTGCHWMFTGC